MDPHRRVRNCVQSNITWLEGLLPRHSSSEDFERLVDCVFLSLWTDKHAFMTKLCRVVYIKWSEENCTGESNNGQFRSPKCNKAVRFVNQQKQFTLRRHAINGTRQSPVVPEKKQIITDHRGWRYGTASLRRTSFWWSFIIIKPVSCR